MLGFRNMPIRWISNFDTEVIFSAEIDMNLKDGLVNSLAKEIDEGAPDH